MADMTESSTDIVEVLASPPSAEGGEAAGSLSGQGGEDATTLKCIHLEGFSSPITLSDAQKDSYLRRFGTLFVDERCSREGGTSRVLHGVNAFGEHFAIKVRKPDDAPDPLSFEHEYAVHRMLSDIKGYPYLYGEARLDGQSALIMEWIEGEDLLHASARMAVDDEGRLSPLVVARLGRDLFDVLARTNALEHEVVHGDISLRNIMLSIKHQPIEAQVQEGAFNVRLIDLSSSRIASAGGSSAEADACIGGATQEFAPPELQDDEGRRGDRSGRGKQPSRASDVYAMASILCRLAYGNANPSKSAQPFRTAHDASNDIAAVLSHEPEVAVAVQRASAEFTPYPTAQEISLALMQVDEPLADLLQSCLAQDPAKRPSASEMRDALDSFSSSYRMNIGRALRGERLEPCKASFIHSGIEGLPLKARNLIRVIGKSISIGLGVAVVLTTALVLSMGDVSVDLEGIHLEGTGAGAMAALLLIPALSVSLLRSARRYSFAGLLRGSAGIAVGGACLGAIAALAVFDPPAMKQLYAWAVFAAAVMSWCPFVLDCAFPALSARVRSRRHLLPHSGTEDPSFASSVDATPLAFGSGTEAPKSLKDPRSLDEKLLAEGDGHVKG